MNKNKRSKLFPLNPYQQSIVAIALLPTITITIIVSLVLIVFFKNIVHVLNDPLADFSVNLLAEWAIYIFSIMWLMVILILIWAYSISTKMVGAFVRIINEMDEMVETGKKKKLHVRHKDDLAAELTKRINKLLD